MFSATEYQYIQNLTMNMYDKGYTYYSCITNNPTNYTNNNVYDVICYYSQDNSLNTGVTCSFDSNNYSENNTIDKLSCEDFNTKPTFSSKEFIYSNVENYSANIIAEYQRDSIFQDVIRLTSITITCLLVMIFIYSFISKILRS